ncbi:MAG TPA: thiamine phosphate synthase [bacterium]|nr:thiamine phosphate synthase [bacterium]HNJ72113.1 thiamine phosphate synthase [bacterium]HNO91556.1 thiamine phosphate synthase [bacterium]
MNKRLNVSLYFIADVGMIPAGKICSVVEEAIQGGVTFVQLRAKTLSVNAMIALGRTIHQVTYSKNIPLIINDRIEVAAAIGAEGIHLGQEDITVGAARKILGDSAIIGISTHTQQEAQTAESAGADYIGVGTVFPTASKKDIVGIIGTTGLKQIRDLVKLPVVAIGGINQNNVKEVLACGVDGIAVISAIGLSVNPRETTRALKNLLTVN